MLPSIFRDNLFDDMFDFDDFDKEFNRMMRPLYGKQCSRTMMKTECPRDRQQATSWISTCQGLQER